MKLVLASSSPNRKELLDRLGLPYEIILPNYEEVINSEFSPVEQVQEFAFGKALSVHRKLNLPKSLFIKRDLKEDYIIMGFDSMIEFEGGSLGKAQNEKEAFEMIKSFIGKPQRVITGFSLIGEYAGKSFEITDFEATKVKFRKNIKDSEIKKYIDFGDWKGKCGSYSILGPGIFFLEDIEGDFQNIIGIPLIKINKKLIKLLNHSITELI